MDYIKKKTGKKTYILKEKMKKKKKVQIQTLISAKFFFFMNTFILTTN